MNTKDTFSIILSFLQPKELSKSLLLSHLHRQWTLDWLSLRGYNGYNNIEENVCPICCHWKSNQNIKEYDEFFDRPPYIGHFIRKYIETRILPQPNERTSLFCIDCEYEEYYVDHIDDFKFPFRGNRVYYLYQNNYDNNMFSHNSYTIVYKKQTYPTTVSPVWQWNEIRMIT